MAFLDFRWTSYRVLPIEGEQVSYSFQVPPLLHSLFGLAEGVDQARRWNTE